MPRVAAQVNLYAMMTTYPLMRHFMTTEIARHCAELDYSFTRTDMNAYFTELMAEYENFVTIADSTVSRMRFTASGAGYSMSWFINGMS